MDCVESLRVFVNSIFPPMEYIEAVWPPLMETVKPIFSKLNLNIDDNPVLTQFLLYGNKALTHAQNQGILNATLTYIRNTGRFSRDIR